MLTRLSVHCALRIVATNSWYGESKFNAHLASGCVRWSRSKISGARVVAGARRDASMRPPRLPAGASGFGLEAPRRSFVVLAGCSFSMTGGFGRDRESGCRGGFCLLRMHGKLMPPAAREREHIIRRSRVEQIARFEPSLARHADPDRDVVERIDGMRVGSKSNRRTLTFGLDEESPVEVETARIGIELESNADLGGFLDHGLDVDRVRLA